MKNIFAQRCREALLRRYQQSEVVEPAVRNLEDALARFKKSGCADSNFEKQLHTEDHAEFSQRLGELLLYERLAHAGFQLSSKDRGPDLRVDRNGAITWLELVTPSTGDDTKIKKLHDSYDPLNPNADHGQELSERNLLRVCSQIKGKLEKFEKYLEDGIVHPEDACVIVINDALLCSDFAYVGVAHGANAGIGGRSIVEHAVLGIGHRYWAEIEGETQYRSVSNFREQVINRPEPNRSGNPRKPVPVNLFTKPEQDRPQGMAARAKVISAIMQVTLREDYGHLMQLRDLVERGDRRGEHLLYPGTLVLNPNANVLLSQSARRDLRRMINLPPMSPEQQLEVERQRLAMLTGSPDIPEQQTSLGGDDQTTTELVSAFRADGYVVIPPNESMAAWLEQATEEADRLAMDGQWEDGWLSRHEFGAPIPESKPLQNLLSELLHSPLERLDRNQISVVSAGFSRPGQHRHVDGAHNGIYWHALLVGVLLDNLPACEPQRGNPLVWPGSQYKTLNAFRTLGTNPDPDALRKAIASVSEGITEDGSPIFGDAGTIFVVDHALVHGMADHATPGFVRRVAYYRIGSCTKEPSEVVNRQHFFKPGI